MFGPTQLIMVAALAVCGSVAAALVVRYVGATGAKGALSLTGTVLLHLALGLAMPGGDRSGSDVLLEERLVVFEAAALPPPPARAPAPPRAPDKAPNAAATPSEPHSAPAAKERAPRNERMAPKRAPREPQEPAAPPATFDVSAATSHGSSVVVRVGPPSEGAYRVDPGHGSTSSAVNPGAAAGEGAVRRDPWKPTSPAFIASLPRPIHVREIPCPATATRGITGTVVLRVQIRADGSVRDVTVVQGIGSGCDGVAVKALRRARFTPAVSTAGRPTPYELRYEYVFSNS